jgi:acetyl esterase/lipase
MSDTGGAAASELDTVTLHPDFHGVRFLTLPFNLLWLLPVWRAAVKFAPAPLLSGVKVTERAGSGARIRVYRADTAPSGAALLWIHGGGLIVGAPIMCDAWCGMVARELGLTVVSAYYRLAPEHPFPAAIEDCLAAWRWVQESVDDLGVDRARVAVGGESAGGGLAACLCQRVHDEGGMQPAGQLLVYPMLDDRTAAHRQLDSAGHLCWNNRSNRAGWASYLGQEPGGALIPDYAVAARRQDLTGLPATWIGVGLLDLFLDEDRDYALRLEQAGVPTTLCQVPGAPHGFLAFAPDVPVSRQFVHGQIEFLRQLLCP